MTNEDILQVAMRQSAVDLGCNAEDFLSSRNKIVISKQNSAARKYLELPFACDLVSYGNNIVASVREDIKKTVKDYIERYQIEHCFETPNLNVFSDALIQYDLKICFMAEYFLPDVNILKKQVCKYATRILSREDFTDLYTREWSNALCAKRKEYDVLGVGAYDNDTLIGLAACSADCEDMWQIGIDVLPEYRRKGIAAALTSELALEILKRGKVPFYCVAWSNIKSIRNAIKSGFRPAWVEMTAKNSKFVDEMNKL